MHAIERMIQAYHDLCEREPHLVEESAAMLQTEQPKRRLLFGDRLLCNVLRPHFLTHEQYAYIRKRIALVADALRNAFGALMNDATLRAELFLSPMEEEVIHYDFGYATPVPTSRMDTFLNHDGTFHFVEYNAETPAGAGYEAELSRLFLELPIMQRFLETHVVEILPYRRPLLDTLLALYEQAGYTEHPTIAIVDWEGVSTRPEHEILRDYFERHGYPTVWADPRALDYDGTTLRAEGRPVHIVYKRVLTSELLNRLGLDTPLVRAVRDRNVLIVNPFRCKLLHKKAIFAILTDERFAHLYTPEQQAAIREHVPWTRVVRERTTYLDGEPIDLLSYVAQHRDQFVLKPNDEYGGSGVVIGWDVSQAEWEQALQNALNEPTIVQRRVKVAEEPFPAFIDGQLHIANRLVDLDPYIYNGFDVQACLTRLSATSLLNVTAGTGSVVPTMLVSPSDA